MMKKRNSKKKSLKKLGRPILQSYYYKDLERSKYLAANNRLQKTYGITADDYDRMFKEQNEACWICKKEPKTIRLSVDHRHVYGFKKMDPKDKRKEVRGLLCFVCNTAIGKLEKVKDARHRFEAMKQYFNKFKMRGDE